MPSDDAGKLPKGKLKASIIHDYRINAVNFFADYTDIGKDLHVFSERFNSLSDVLVFLSSNFPCPACNEPKLRQKENWSLKEWFLKFFGRRVLRCNKCGWESTVKMYRCEWETIITALAVLVVLLLYSTYLVLTKK